MSFRSISLRIALTTALLLVVSASAFSIGSGNSVQKAMGTMTGIFAHPKADDATDPVPGSVSAKVAAFKTGTEEAAQKVVDQVKASTEPVIESASAKVEAIKTGTEDVAQKVVDKVSALKTGTEDAAQTVVDKVKGAFAHPDADSTDPDPDSAAAKLASLKNGAKDAAKETKDKVKDMFAHSDGDSAKP